MIEEKKDISIFIADDHPIFRAGIRQITDSTDINIVGEAASGEIALKLIVELKPDIAILDIDMPVLDGLSLLHELARAKCATKTVFLTVHKNEKLFNEAMDSGAYGYVLKENASSDLIDCINSVYRGGYYISPIISDLLFNRIRKRKEIEEKYPEINYLTGIERKILKMIAEQKSSKQIADEFFISYRTVEKHRENISNKLNIHGSNAILKFAIDNKSSL